MPDDEIEVDATDPDFPRLSIGPRELLERAERYNEIGSTPAAETLYLAWFDAMKGGPITEAEVFAAMIRLVSTVLEHQHCDICRGVFVGMLAIGSQACCAQQRVHRAEAAAASTDDPEVKAAIMEALHAQAH